MVSGLTLTGCSEEDNPENNIIGKWTTTEFDAGILVNSVPVIRWYTEKYNTSETEATDFANSIIRDVEINLTGTMQFNSDHSYQINFGDEPEETGVWQLVDNNQKLSFTNSKNNESNESDVKALSSSILILGFSDSNWGDVDKDGQNDNLFISINLTLEK